MAATIPTTTCQVYSTFDPCPRVGVTVDGLSTGSTVYTLWRTADGKRAAVRAARYRTATGSDFVWDFEAPLNRNVLYDVEVVSGTQLGQPTSPATVTVPCTTWAVQDPLVPSSAIALQVTNTDQGLPTLTAAAVKTLEYDAGVTILPIIGSPEPIALVGGRQLATGLDLSMFTRMVETTTKLRNLIQTAPLLLVRSSGLRNDGVPGLAYFVSAKPVEQPQTVAFGGTLTRWQLTGDLVASPSLSVLVPVWTYGNVQDLWATYQQAQTTLSGKTYLDVLKSPSGV